MNVFPLGRLAYVEPDSSSSYYFPDLEKPVNVIAYHPGGLKTNEVYLVERQISGRACVSRRVFTEGEKARIYVNMDVTDFRNLTDEQYERLEWLYPEEVRLIKDVKEEKSKIAKMTLDNL